MNILQFFAYSHLKPPLQEVSKEFCEVALHLVATLGNVRPKYASEETIEDLWEYVDAFSAKLKNKLPKNRSYELYTVHMAEATDGISERYELEDILESLLQAKDAAVRAVLCKPGEFTVTPIGAAIPLVDGINK